MKALTPIITLVALFALCPLALANTESKPQPGPFVSGECNTMDADVSSDSSSSTLTHHVGKTIFVKGQLISVHNGGVCMVPDETPAVQISIDPVKRPKYGELPSQQWASNNGRRKKLHRLINDNEMGDTVELTGKLCHVTSSTRGNSPGNADSSQNPDSHFFFSVNDVTILSAGSPLQK